MGGGGEGWLLEGEAEKGGGDALGETLEAEGGGDARNPCRIMAETSPLFRMWSAAAAAAAAMEADEEEIAAQDLEEEAPLAIFVVVAGRNY